MEAIDRKFAEAFQAASEDRRRVLGDGDHPVVIRLEDDLHYLRDGTWSFKVVGERYHLLKRIAHLPIALFLDRVSLDRHENTSLELVRAVREEYEARREEVGACAEVIAIVFEACTDFLDACRGISSPEYHAVRALSDAVYTPLNEIVTTAAEEEVRRLHDVVIRLEEMTPPRQWASTYFAVAGGLQPRYKELTRTYLTRYLSRARSLKGGFRHRVIYAEGEHTVDSILDLIAKREVNRVLGETFAGSPLGLDQDILGDAAERAIAAVLDEESARHG